MTKNCCRNSCQNRPFRATALEKTEWPFYTERKQDAKSDEGRSEHFFEIAQKADLTNAVIALSGVAGLNAAEHLRSLCPACRMIWCSDLDFSLHAFRLRADYFLMKPVSEEAFQRGLNAWIE